MKISGTTCFLSKKQAVFVEAQFLLAIPAIGNQRATPRDAIVHAGRGRRGWRGRHVAEPIVAEERGLSIGREAMMRFRWQIVIGQEVPLRLFKSEPGIPEW